MEMTVTTPLEQELLGKLEAAEASAAAMREALEGAVEDLIMTRSYLADEEDKERSLLVESRIGAALLSSSAGAELLERLRTAEESRDEYRALTLKQHNKTVEAVEAIKRAEAAEKERDELRERLEEREHDMHLRIRAGYDKTVADTWRAEVSKAEARIARLEQALKKYGKHTSSCDLRTPCLCGLDAALEGKS